MLLLLPHRSFVLGPQQQRLLLQLLLLYRIIPITDTNAMVAAVAATTDPTFSLYFDDSLKKIIHVRHI